MNEPTQHVDCYACTVQPPLSEGRELLTVLSVSSEVPSRLPRLFFCRVSSEGRVLMLRLYIIELFDWNVVVVVEISGVLDDARRKSVASSEDIALCKALCVSSVDHDVTGERATWMSRNTTHTEPHDTWPASVCLVSGVMSSA